MHLNSAPQHMNFSYDLLEVIAEMRAPFGSTCVVPAMTSNMFCNQMNRTSKSLYCDWRKTSEAP